MRALKRLRIPTLLYVNKIDRRGARSEWVLSEIRHKLAPAAVAVTSARGEGSRGVVVAAPADGDVQFGAALVDVLAANDEALLAAYLDDEARVSSQRLRAALAAQTTGALVHPVFYGSAITGAGIELLTQGIAQLLPSSSGAGDDPVSGLVFKIERGPLGERIAYVRMFSGTLQMRDRVRIGRDGEGKVTALRVFADGTDLQRASVTAGEIAKVSGLGDVQIGDSIGDAPNRRMPHEFPPPTLEALVDPLNSDDRYGLRVALGQLAEQDPLINLRQDDRRHEISISLYGEVQKEVIEATLANDYEMAVSFRETTPIYIECPCRTAEAVELLRAESNPFLATIGLRVDPAPGGGIEFRLQVDPRTVPLYLYKTLDSFRQRMEEYVHQTLREGLFGWQVSDCVVTMTRCVYSVPDGPPSRRGPLSTAADFRKLTPIVLMQALARAGAVVCEPVLSVTVEMPTEAVGSVLPLLARVGGAVQSPSLDGELATVDAVVPAARVREVQRQLPELTAGEGVLETTFAGYQPVSGEAPTRRRTTANPLNLEEYLAELAGHRAGATAE